MSGIADKIAQRASEMNLEKINWDTCLWTEQIPRFYRHETDAETSPRIMEHLEKCEECNILLMALAVQSHSKAKVSWIKQGIRHVLNQTVFLWDIMSAGFEGQMAQLPALRGPRDNYSPAEEKIVLPDGSSLSIKIIDTDVKSHKQVLTIAIYSEARRQYEFYTRNGDILKSVDNANEIKFVMPNDDVVLLVDGCFEINLGNDHGNSKSRP